MPPRGDLDVQRRARDAAVRRTRIVVAGVAAGAVGLSGLLSVVAAQAFKGHTRPASAAPAATVAGARVPGPDRVPPIAGQPAPLAPPAQAPTAAPTTSPPGPVPQVSGGS